MKTFIRLLSVFLAVLMICFSFPLSVLAVEPSADQEVQAVEYDKMGNVTEVAPAAVDDMGTGYAFQVDSEDPNVNYSYNSATKRLERIETQSTAYT